MTLFKNKYRIESARLPGWDYRNPGHYFVTICVKNRLHAFGKIINGEMHLSPVGEIAAQCWAEIPQHHAGVALDEFVIMPNHAHGIVVLTAPIVFSVVETLQCNDSTTQKTSAISPKTGSLAVVIRSYKSAVSRLARLAGHEFGWQERFWDHIVRDNGEFLRIRHYIVQNPVKWNTDRNNEPGIWM